MSDLRDDLLDGAADFAAFTGWPIRRTFYALESGLLPAGKLGRKWIGSKRKVRERLEQITSGEAA